MNERPVVVKLGGSILTRKRREPRVRQKLLAHLSEQLAELADLPIVLLHGAGSFGHPGAVRFGLAEPPKPGVRDRPRGTAIVGTEVRRLHQRVLDALVDAGVRPVSVPPYPIAQNRAGALQIFPEGPFRQAIQSGLLPVSFGDVVEDAEWGSSILSADTIALRLAAALPARRVVFVSDVDGVFEQRPSGERTIVEQLNPGTLATLHPAPGVPDVTGGIRGKVEAMLAIAEAGIDAVLISGLRDGALRQAVQGDSVYGSWARASPGAVAGDRA